MGQEANEVWCYSSHTYAVEPQAFMLNGSRHAVTRVLARWRTPAGPGFRVSSDCGEILLTYREETDTWHIEPCMPSQQTKVD